MVSVFQTLLILNLTSIEVPAMLIMNATRIVTRTMTGWTLCLTPPQLVHRTVPLLPVPFRDQQIDNSMKFSRVESWCRSIG